MTKTTASSVKSENVFHAQNFINGTWRGGAKCFEVIEPYGGRAVTVAQIADEATTRSAVDAASEAASTVAALKGFERALILRRASALLAEKAEPVARSITRETGKAIRDTRVELRRASEVLSLCADEAIRIEGRHIPLDGSSVGAGKVAFALRFPIGVVGAIVPFNAPANLSCHKVGPAFAAGNTIVLKSTPQAPYSLQLLFEVFAEAGFPQGAINLLHGGPDVGQALIADPRVGFISFTGSGRAGAAIKAAAGLRGCILELGGLGPVIVHRDADLQLAAQLCVANGFRLSGQSCASVQNLFVHRAVAEEFTAMMVAQMARLKTGDPMDPEVDLGPVIDETAAKRIQTWIHEAVDQGATLLCGGGRDGTMLQPTLLSDVRPEMKVVCEEVFGPVVVLRPYEDLTAVHRWINGTGLGLNCGLFTTSHAVALETLRAAPCAALIINGTSTFRPDQIPYGGLRNSGYGRESPADSIRAMTQERIIVFN